MSKAYDNYLIEHKNNVNKGFFWMADYLTRIVANIEPEIQNDIMYNHDLSKYEKDEYDAYDAYFYGGEKSEYVNNEFNRAWLLHIHRNPHHWQHWVLINDDPENGEIILDMPYGRIVEMICDWWSFSWKSENLFEIFDWYEKHKDYIKLSGNTRYTVESILELMKDKLEELEYGQKRINERAIR